MKNRVIFGILLILLLVAAISVGGYLFRFFALLVGVLAVHEISLTIQKKPDAFLMAPVYCGMLVSILGIGRFENRVLAMIWIVALICILSVTVCRGVKVTDALYSMFICIYPVFFLLFILFGYFCLPPKLSLPYTILTAGGPSLCDTFAYFGGIRFGKRKLCPSISPHKTIAGSLFAIAGGILSGMLVFFFQRFWDGSCGISFFLVAGLLIGIFSQIGDLFASRIKRWAEVKDFSSLIPGHGGVMDRIDSTLVTGGVMLVLFLLLG